MKPKMFPLLLTFLAMFISILSFMKFKKMLLIVSFAYILGGLITYFLVGFGLLQFLTTPAVIQLMADLGQLLYIIFAVMVLLWLLVTLYDFLVNKNEDYDKVKNQRPSKIKRFNKT